ncbi:MAG: hypothetical protein ACJ79D_12910 [Myxococcales bacterium]
MRDASGELLQLGGLAFHELSVLLLQPDHVPHGADGHGGGYRGEDGAHRIELQSELVGPLVDGLDPRRHLLRFAGVHVEYLLRRLGRRIAVGEQLAHGR